MRAIKLAVLHLCRLCGLFALAKYRNRNKLLILCYHGFAFDDEAQFRPKLFMTPKLFAQRMERLKKWRLNVIPLGDAVDRLNSGTLPERSAVITIDDGFASVEKLALDVLQKHKLPSTLYVTSYYVNKGTPIFRLAVQYLFWKSTVHQANLGALPWLPSDDHSHASKVDLTDNATAEKLIWACIDFGEKSCTEPERQTILLELANRLDVNFAPVLESRALALLTGDEIRHLSESGVDIQLHTHRHTLPVTDLNQANEELVHNRDQLSQFVSTPLVHFCYPSGVWHQDHWSMLEENGVLSATTCDPGHNDAQSHRFALTRFLDAESISEIEFDSEVSGFADWLRGLKKLRS